MAKTNRIPKQRIIYDNYSLWETYPDEDVIEQLVENGIEREEISDDDIWKERDYMDEFDWENAEYELKHFFNKFDHLLVTGSVGRWNGVFDGGKVFNSWEKLISYCGKDCDRFKFFDENGHFYISCSHHDGSCSFEVKILSDAGADYYDRWQYSWDDKRTESEVFSQMYKRYSTLPRFSERVYGCKRIEYEPITKAGLITRLNDRAVSYYGITQYV